MNAFPSKSLSDNRKSKTENRKWLGLSVIAFALVLTGTVAEAQQAMKVARIGYLALTAPTNHVRANAFRLELGRLGYAEGKDVVIDYRYAEGNLDRLRELAGELVRLKVNVIVAGGPAPARAAKAATATIPIVMTQDRSRGQGVRRQPCATGTATTASGSAAISPPRVDRDQRRSFLRHQRKKLTDYLEQIA